MSRRVDVREEQSPALADVAKTMKSILPTDCSVDPDALDLVKKCVSRFISSISSEAIARSIHHGSTALTSDEIVQSLENFGFVDYKTPIEMYLNKFSSHTIMKRPAEVIKSKKTTKHVNSSSMVPKIPKSKSVVKAGPYVPKILPSVLAGSARSSVPAVGASSSSSSSSSAAVPSSQQRSYPDNTIPLPASLMSPNKSTAQKMEEAILFAIKNPNISIKKLCEAVNISRHLFKDALHLHLQAMKIAQPNITTMSTVTIPAVAAVTTAAVATTTTAASSSSSSSSSSGVSVKPETVSASQP